MIGGRTGLGGEDLGKAMEVGALWVRFGREN